MARGESDEWLNGITDLSDVETGTWIVATRDSQHLFDLDHRTVTRIPGPTALPSVNDRPRRLRAIDSARVGERGAWTMHADEDSEIVDYFWAETSVVASITRIESATIQPPR